MVGLVLYYRRIALWLKIHNLYLISLMFDIENVSVNREEVVKESAKVPV